MTVKGLGMDDVEIHFDTTTSNFFSTSSEIEGASGVSVTGGGHGYVIKHGFSSTESNRYYGTRTPADKVTIEITDAVFDGTTLDGYFSNTSFAECTETVCIGLKFGSTYSIKVADAVMTKRDIKASVDGFITADMAFEALPTNVTD